MLISSLLIISACGASDLRTRIIKGSRAGVSAFAFICRDETAAAMDLICRAQLLAFHSEGLM